jgi:hypothetical protein
VIFFARMLCLLAISTTAFAGDTRSEQWRADLDFLVRELSIRQPDFGPEMQQKPFREAAARLHAQIPGLTDAQITVEFARLLARLGDGHTGIFLPWDRENGFHRLPLELWYGADGLLILAATPEHRSLAGSVITRIGSTEVATIEAAIRPLLPLDNDWGARSLLQSYIVLPELLQALGFIERTDVVPLTVRDQHGKERQVSIAPAARGVPLDLELIAQVEQPLWLRNRKERFWFTSIDEDKLTYVQFNSADVSPAAEASFNDSLQTLVEHVLKRNDEKLVIDLRWNSGGSFARTRKLLNAVIRMDRLNKRGHLFTIISPTTYSAGVTHAARLNQYTETLFVGEPTGGSPAHVGELRRFRLPNNRLEVRYSAVIVSDPGDRREAIMPDLYTPLDAAAYRAGIDPALEAILAYKERLPIGDLVRQKLQAEGAKAAVGAYREARRARFNEFVFSEEQLQSLISELTGRREHEAAIVVAELFVSEYPKSATAHFVLASAREAAGDRDQAAASFERAFELDPRFTTALERARDLRRVSETSPP